MSETLEQNHSPINPLKSNGIEDHIRVQFEQLQRQPELAPDMKCFRAGGELSSIRFIAHPHSVHVARWLKVLSHTQSRVTIETANPVSAFENEFVAAHPLIPRLLKLPMGLRYLVGGLALRFGRSRNKNNLIHAHSASGNGFVAWLSGHRYLIGTYGSEIYGAKQRGALYRWLLKQILQRAERISVCSTECTKILVEQYGIPAERIYFFHLGYDDTTFRPLSLEHRRQLRRERNLPANEPIWVVNRRTHPHYRTLDVVQGFFEYCNQNGRGRLVLICGDSDREYTKSVCQLVQQNALGSRVTIVTQMLSAADLAKWLQLGDFSISVPKTDNFSISTLESLGCATVPILADLEGYDSLRPCKAVRWMNRFEPDDFAAMFADTQSSWPTGHESHRSECTRFVQNGFSTEGAIRDVASFYLGYPLSDSKPMMRAA